MIEGIGGMLRGIWEAPGKFLDSLDPKDGHGPEDMGAIGKIGAEKARKFMDPKTPFDGD